MRIAVLQKQVPDRESPLRISDDGRHFDEQQISFELNESDAYAIEEALQLKDRLGAETEIIALGLGPERIEKTLREALARGADRAIRILDDRELATDPFAVASVFAAALKGQGCDLVLSGLQSDDLGMGQTGILLGELLGMATASLVIATEPDTASIRVKRELEGGWYQWLTVPLPASLNIQTGINQPRYPTIKGIMGAKRKPIEVLSASALWSGEPLQTCQRLYVPQKAKHTEMIEGTPDQAAAQLVEILKTGIKVL